MAETAKRSGFFDDLGNWGAAFAPGLKGLSRHLSGLGRGEMRLVLPRRRLSLASCAGHPSSRYLEPPHWIPGIALQRQRRVGATNRLTWLSAAGIRVRAALLALVVGWPDDRDRAVRVMDAVGADRAEQRVGHAAIPAGAHYQQLGPF